MVNKGTATSVRPFIPLHTVRFSSESWLCNAAAPAPSIYLHHDTIFLFVHQSIFSTFKHLKMLHLTFWDCLKVSTSCSVYFSENGWDLSCPIYCAPLSLLPTVYSCFILITLNIFPRLLCCELVLWNTELDRAFGLFMRFNEEDLWCPWII